MKVRFLILLTLLCATLILISKLITSAHATNQPSQENAQRKIAPWVMEPNRPRKLLIPLMGRHKVKFVGHKMNLRDLMELPIHPSDPCQSDYFLRSANLTRAEPRLNSSIIRFR